MNRELLHWRAGAAIVGVAVVIGALQGLLWARTAPGEQFYVQADGQFEGLPTASYHQFTSLAIFVLIALVVAVPMATAVWTWRSIRGTVAVWVLLGANSLGALTAYLIGRVLAAGVDPATIGPTSAASIVIAAPNAGSAMVLIVQPGVAVAVYTFLVAWNGRPNLGRPDLPEEELQPQAPPRAWSGSDPWDAPDTSAQGR